MRNHDLTFLKHFSQLIAALVALAILLIFLAHWIYGQQPVEPNTAAEDAASARIEPVSAVYAGDTGAAAMAAAREAAMAEAASKVAFDGTLDGSVIFENVCSVCHNTGAAGAPKLTKAEWSTRVAQGVDTLVNHAVNGFQGGAGVMPARGGNMSLSDEQVEATVRWMVDNLK